ncbi:hypothetical protein [Asaia krungthepensis]|uniref:Uncharacterized protein n=1 Tax=Asaia krungthepensis NRIC 0535 TaxID=1307925 RepID=A0ABQ0Q2Y4_9PROT|nr:hypothetical protein [Asaia krungthepensis]GBQ88870.1 hypothetical protein AA0535_1648 [Asaia krungthepensis NRIC 0535]
MSETTTTTETASILPEVEALGISLLPTVAAIIIKKLAPNCDVDGAVSAVTGIANNLKALETALETKTTQVA